MDADRLHDDISISRRGKKGQPCAVGPREPLPKGRPKALTWTQINPGESLKRLELATEFS
jgi:hypothetical protein